LPLATHLPRDYVTANELYRFVWYATKRFVRRSDSEVPPMHHVYAKVIVESKQWTWVELPPPGDEKPQESDDEDVHNDGDGKGQDNSAAHSHGDNGEEAAQSASSAGEAAGDSQSPHDGDDAIASPDKEGSDSVGPDKIALHETSSSHSMPAAASEP